MSMYDDQPVCPSDCRCGRWDPCPGYVRTFWDDVKDNYVTIERLPKLPWWFGLQMWWF